MEQRSSATARSELDLENSQSVSSYGLACVWSRSSRRLPIRSRLWAFWLGLPGGLCGQVVGARCADGVDFASGLHEPWCKEYGYGCTCWSSIVCMCQVS